MFEIRTTRLTLRDLAEEDWKMVDALSRAPGVTRYQTWLRLESPEAARRWVGDAMKANSDSPRRAYNLAIVRRDTGAPIGWIGWGPPSEPGRGDQDFGYALLPAEWGRGFMSEALRAAVAFMVEELGAGVVFGECEAENRASARVMQNAGLTLVASWAEPGDAGATVQHERYTIDAAAWRRQRSQPDAS